MRHFAIFLALFSVTASNANTIDYDCVTNYMPEHGVELNSTEGNYVAEYFDNDTWLTLECDSDNPEGMTCYGKDEGKHKNREVIMEFHFMGRSTILQAKMVETWNKEGGDDHEATYSCTPKTN